jgi:hypothetical protein
MKWFPQSCGCELNRQRNYAWKNEERHWALQSQAQQCFVTAHPSINDFVAIIQNEELPTQAWWGRFVLAG